MITKDIVAGRIAAWLRHEISLASLVDWAERAIHEGDVPEADTEELMPILGRLGLADVKQFGLSWEDCEELLGRLGYAVRVEITAA